MDDYIPAVELIYRDLARPKSAVTKPTPRSEPAKQLSRDDVHAILQRQRGASATELQQIIDSARDYKLTRGERDQLSVDLTIAISQARQGNGRCTDPNARFVAQVLNLIETPFGLIEQSFVNDLMRAGSQNISRCHDHKTPHCQCWAAQRAILWHTRSVHQEKSPESWAAAKIYESLKELELAYRLPGESHVPRGNSGIEF